MANENKNINELVDDDDPTVELEIASFPKAISESDERTYDAAEDDDAGLPNGVSVSELKSDLLARKETINQLQYDIRCHGVAAKKPDAGDQRAGIVGFRPRNAARAVGILRRCDARTAAGPD